MYERPGSRNQKEYVVILIHHCESLPKSLSTVVYLYLVSYGRGKPDQIQHAITYFLTVRKHPFQSQDKLT